MAFRITPPSEVPTVDILIPTDSGEVEVRLPKLSYVPREVAADADKWQVERILEVSKKRAERERKKLPIAAADPDLRWPGSLELMDRMLSLLVPEHAELIGGLTFGEREQIWEHWQAESKVDAEKSSASSDS